MVVREHRKSRGIVATFKSVDTCAAEFEAYTPYYYSTYEDEDETPPKRPDKQRIMILGGGPNRIGQGIEFDYCCCHASFALREMGIESIMVNSNPETVSTDYDTSDLLFFEPLTTEDVLNIFDRVQPDGVIVQFGGQTPLEPGAGAGHGGRADHRHQRGHDRGGRGPREVQEAADRVGPEAAGQRHRPNLNQARDEAAARRLPGAGAAQLRAGRAGHGDLLRRRRSSSGSWPRRSSPPRASRC